MKSLFAGNITLQKVVLLMLSVSLTPCIAFAIDEPLNPRGTETSQSTVTWQWDPVEGASEYEVTIDGNVAGRTTEPQFLSHDLWAGDHSLTVKSISVDSQHSSASLTAKVQVRETFDSNTTNQSYLVGSYGTNFGRGDQPQFSAPTQSPTQTPTNDHGLVDPASWASPDVQAKSGYDLVFSDEFNGSTLNANRWNAQLRWDGEFNGERYEYRVINGEDQFYVNILSDDQKHLDTVASRHNPFEFDGSRLAIRAKRNPMQQTKGNKTYGPLAEIVAQQSILSGAISTYDKFTQKYGYFEARMKIPSHIGTFPAFWLHHQKRAWEGTKRTEIDIMENLGHAPWYIYNSFHYNTNVSATNYGDAHFIKPQPEGQIYTGVDYSQDYHVYAVEWEPGHITWLIDGEKVSELWNENVDYEKLYLIINLAMGGDWTNFPTNSGGLGRPAGEHFPTDNDLKPENFHNPALEIDYVRVYKKK